jgi:4-hydroxyphenylacetate 3-monooxygenase
LLEKPELFGLPASQPQRGLPITMEITRPMNGAEFIESLRDGREVYIYGDRVKDVTTHPAFRNTARMVARMYDALHDPKR